MAKRRREIDSDGPNAEAISPNIVFVDTSLDTHLLMIISSSDTVANFKKKILLQHSESFPRIGEIKIHSLQVKRLGHFYHLPDSLLVSSAFYGSKRTWFLFVEASCSQQNDEAEPSCKPDGIKNVSLPYLQNHSQGEHYNLLNDNPFKLMSEMVPQTVQTSPRNFSGELSRDIEMEVGHLQDHYPKELFSGTNENLALPGDTIEKNIKFSENPGRSEDDNSRDNNKIPVESSLDELPSAAKKRKIEPVENADLIIKKRKIENKRDPPVDAIGKVPSDMQTAQTDVREELYDTLSSDANLTLISGAHKTSQSEPNAVQSDNLGREEVYRGRSISTSGEHVSEVERVPSLQEVKQDDLETVVDSKKRNKNKKETPFVPHAEVATSEPLLVRHGSSFHANLNSEAPEANKNEGHVELALNHNPEVMLSERCKPLDQGEADGPNEESIRSPNFSRASCPTEAVDSVRTKRKKKSTKKKAPGKQAFSTGKETAGTISSTVADSAPEGHMNDMIDNHEIILSFNESDHNNRSEKERGLSDNHHPEEQPFRNFKPSDQVEAQEMNKGSILSPIMSGANKLTEAGNSGTVKRKKKNAKKSAAKLQDKSHVENFHGSLPAQGLVLDVQMNDGTTEKNEIVPHTEAELLAKGNKLLDSDEETMNGREAGFAEMSLGEKNGFEAGKSGDCHKKKRVRKPPTANDDLPCMEHSNPANDTPAKHSEGDGGLLIKHGPELISSKASKILDLGEATVHVSESGFAAQPLNNEEGLEVGKSAGSKKKRRGKKHATSMCDSHAKLSASEAQGNQSILSHTEVKETSKKESRNASASRTRKGNEASKSKEIVAPLAAETEQTQENTKNLEENVAEARIGESMDTNALQDRPVKVQANDVQHLEREEADKEQENTGTIKKKVKKKTKRNQNAAAEAQSNSKTKEQNIGFEELAASGDKLGDRDHPYDTTKTSISTELRTGNRSAVPELLEKNAGVKSKYSNPEQVPGGADSSDVPSYHTPENNLEFGPETMTNIGSIVEVSTAGDEGINFRHYFVPGEHQSEDTSANKVKEALHSAQAKRKAKMSNVASKRTLGSNQEIRSKSGANIYQLEESSPDAKGNEDMPLTNKETSKASGHVVKASKSHDTDKVKTHLKATRSVVANGSGSSKTIPSWLEENSGSVTAASSSSSAKSAKKALQDTKNSKQQSGFNTDYTSPRKFLRKNDGDIVNSSQQGKSLLTSAGAIFSDCSSESAGNKNGVENSDASTRTLSGSSSSSGHSVGESELSRDSKGNESENKTRNDGGRKSTSISKFSDPKDMSLDMILRSSRRFKKAKLTASQAQDPDIESQPVDFVPESQAS